MTPEDVRAALEHPYGCIVEGDGDATELATSLSKAVLEARPGATIIALSLDAYRSSESRTVAECLHRFATDAVEGMGIAVSAVWLWEQTPPRRRLYRVAEALARTCPSGVVLVLRTSEEFTKSRTAGELYYALREYGEARVDPDAVLCRLRVILVSPVPVSHLDLTEFRRFSV